MRSETMSSSSRKLAKIRHHFGARDTEGNRSARGARKRSARQTGYGTAIGMKVFLELWVKEAGLARRADLTQFGIDERDDGTMIEPRVPDQRPRQSERDVLREICGSDRAGNESDIVIQSVQKLLRRGAITISPDVGAYASRGHRQSSDPSLLSKGKREFRSWSVAKGSADKRSVNSTAKASSKFSQICCIDIAWP